MRRSSDFFAHWMAVCVLVALPGSGMAAEPLICAAADTLGECSNKINAQVNSRKAEVPTAEALASEARATVAKFNTGPSTAVESAGAATTNDYLPFIQALLGMNPASGDDAGHLALEFSDFLPLPEGIQHKFTAQLLGNELYEPLDQALEAAGLGDERAEFIDSMQANDDLSFTLSVSRSSGVDGRDPRAHPELFAALLRASVTKDPARFAQAQARFLGLVETVRQKTASSPTPFDPGNLDKPKVGFTAIEDELHRAQVMAAYEEMELASHEDLSRIRENLRANGFYTALELLSNNPQWNLLANYRSRDDVAGPDEWNASLTYEVGWPSLRGVARKLGCTDDICVAGKFAAHLADPSTKRIQKAVPRFSFNLTYQQRSRYEFVLDAPGFTFSQPSAKSLIGSVSYGQFLTGETGEKARLRMDLNVNYEDVKDDPARNNRGVANLTFSYPLADGTFLTLGVVYANKPEYRGEVDEEFSARAGLVYKFAGSGN